MANNYIALWLVGALIYGLWIAYKYLKFRDTLSTVDFIILIVPAINLICGIGLFSIACVESLLKKGGDNGENG